MAKITKDLELELNLDYGEIAELFCELNEEEQACFFNTLAELTEEWEHPFCMQLQHITDCKILTPEGRAIMKQIGDYAYAKPAEVV